MVRRTVRSRSAGFIIPLFGLLVTAYFVWHGLHGAYGLWSARLLDARVIELSSELDDLRREREEIERRVSLLRAESLDPDMLEERAMVLLNQVHPNDVVIMRSPR